MTREEVGLGALERVHVVLLHWTKFGELLKNQNLEKNEK